ncbi:ankyrin repeat-containing protein NPR4-like [Dendrobium catenatum]|uniref:ankyrin repeat-containing protein NPR4-like n=1 Tax=Dendrobium catenatum TaxID=906689 RepID=UPI0010A0C2CA|nr:ankyrin repeat-containing protein NPR4-like [Dendrobium catenatum]
MGDPTASLDITPIPSFCRKKSFRTTYQDIDNAIRRDDESYLRRHLEELAQKKAETLRRLQKLEEQYYAVNLSGDPLLSVLISYEKTEMAQKLLKYMDEESLLEANLQGNTALHVAAAVGDKVMEIADKLIAKNKLLLNTGNENNETPLLRAALYGQEKMFWMLYDRSDDNAIIEFKRMDGANVLHCAIMGNAPRLALDIAEKFPHLRTRRNTAAVTPLQLMVTIPGAFKSEMEFGLLESFVYKCIPLYDDGERAASFAIKDDYDPGLAIDGVQPIIENQHDEENPQLQRTKSFPPNYAKMLNLLKLTKIPGKNRMGDTAYFQDLKAM